MASSKTISTKGTKKPAKSISQSKTLTNLIAPDAWEEELAGLEINEDNWKCLVAVIEEQLSDATVYIEHFNEVAATGDRLAIKTVSKVEMMNTVIRNMAESNREKELTPLGLLCSEIFKAVGPNFDGKIPTNLLAPLIKYILLDYKALNKKVREGIKLLEKEFQEYQESLWKGTSASGKSSNKTGSGKKGQIKEKTFTKLRRRGEEWKDVTWVDDSPFDGPQLYVTISTFFDADLPLELIKLNVPLNAIICLGLIRVPLLNLAVPIPPGLKKVIKDLKDFRRSSTPYLRSNIRKSAFNEKASLKNYKLKISTFWEHLISITHESPTSMMFKNVMFFDFIPCHSSFDYQIVSFQKEIYKQISYFMYDLFETTKKHKAYLKEMKLIDVSDKEICDLSTKKVYNNLLDNIPHESLTISFILDALMEEVSNSEQSLEITTSTLKTYDPALSLSNTDFIKLLKDLNLKYDLHHSTSLPKITDIQSKSSDLNITQNNQIINNILLHSDEVNIKTFHLEKNIADLIRKRTNYILKTAWSPFFIRHSVPGKNCDQLIKLCNEIIKSKESTGQHELYYYLHILIINSILNSILFLNTDESMFGISSSKDNIFKVCQEGLGENCKAETDQSAPSLTDFLRKRLNNSNSNCPSSPSLFTSSLLDDFVAANLFLFEDLTSDVLLQEIQKVFSTFRYFETRLCPFTDQVIILFHNFLLPDTCHFKETWMGKLTTQVTIRDFVDYILDEENDWLNNHGSKCPLDSDDILLGLQNSSSMSSLITFPNSMFISHRSIKYELLLKETKSERSSTLPLKSAKEVSFKLNTDKQKGEKETINKNELSPEIAKRKVKTREYTFTGYDLGDPMRLQINGCKEEKILNHNCKITTLKVKKLYGEDWNTIDVCVNNHHLYYEYNPSTKLPSSFHLVLSSGIIMSFGSPNEILTDSKPFNHNDLSKQSQPNLPYTLAQIINFEDLSQIEENSSWDSSSSIIYPKNIEEFNYFEICLSYTLKMSTPSGLHIDFVRKSSLFYIRQTLMSKGPSCKNVEQEKCRCLLSDGHVVKFLLSGKIEVLGSNGTVYEIQNMNNKLHDEENQITSLLSERKKKNIRKKFSLTNNNKITEETKNQSSSEKSNVSAAKKPLGTFTLEEEISELGSSIMSHCEYYNCTTSDGRRYCVQNTNVDELPNLYITSSIDIENNCLNSERLDEVSTKHMADGSLQVDFPDGTRITSTPFQSGTVYCNWSDEEFERWFVHSHSLLTESSLGEVDLNQELDYKLSKSENEISAQTKTQNYVSSTLNQQTSKGTSLNSQTTLNQPKFNKLNFSEDGFTVISLKFLIEHPNYSSVFFNLQNGETEINLPCCTKITLNNDGSYDAEFDGASLTVNDDNITFNRLNKSKKVIRSTVINNGGPNENTIIYLSEVFDGNSLVNSLPDTVNAFGFKSLLKEMNISSGVYKRIAYVLLYSMDSSGREVYVDFDLEIHDPCQSIVTKVNGNHFTCFVVNINNLDGFRFVSDNEANDYLHYISKGKGLIQNHNNNLQSIFSSLAVLLNESEKWLMDYDKPSKSSKGNKTSVLHYTPSTYGKKESWLQPFVEKEDSIDELTISETVIIRLLHRIPTGENMLSSLKAALEKFKKTHNQPSKPIKASYNERKCDINLTEIIHDPNIICPIYKQKSLELSKEINNVASNMKNYFLRSIIYKACISARKSRQKIKEDELKSALRNKEIPPYYLSCFGIVHNIVDEVLDNVNHFQEKTSSTSVFARVNSMVYEILSLACKSETFKTTIDSKTDLINIYVSETIKSTGQSKIYLNNSNASERVKSTGQCKIDLSNSAESESVRSIGQSKIDSCNSATSERGQSKTESNNSAADESDSTGINSIMNCIFKNVMDAEISKQTQNIINTILEKPLNLITIENVNFLCNLFKSGSDDCPILPEEEFILRDLLDARLQLSHYFKNMRHLLESYHGLNQVQANAVTDFSSY